MEDAAQDKLTWEEIEEFGTPISSLRPGEWFVTVLANQDTTGMMEMTGKLVYAGIGSVLVSLDRGWEDRVRWAPETKVIKLNKPRTKGTDADE